MASTSSNFEYKSRSQKKLPNCMWIILQYIKKKPCMNTFLNLFADSMSDLFENGIEWRQQSTRLLFKSKVIAPVASLDAPAKAAV